MARSQLHPKVLEEIEALQAEDAHIRKGHIALVTVAMVALLAVVVTSAVVAIKRPWKHPQPVPLEFNSYRYTCPAAEHIIELKVLGLFHHRHSVAPELIRLVFNDCFIGGCDASVLINASAGIRSEKDVIPNLTLKGFDSIDSIKEILELVCPATVSCADIVVLAARDALVLLGAPFYALPTGRRDSISSYAEIALKDLPDPNADLSDFLPKFAARGFDAKETVALLGGHNVGVIHCSFLQRRLYNFSQSASGGSDPSIDAEFYTELTAKCPNVNNLPEKATVNMASSSSKWFGNHYYDTLSQGRGILHADQELLSLKDTARWVEAYRHEGSLFRRHFADVMVKLSNFNVTTSPNGNIRFHCSRTN